MRLGDKNFGIFYAPIKLPIPAIFQISLSVALPKMCAAITTFYLASSTHFKTNLTKWTNNIVTQYHQIEDFPWKTLDRPSSGTKVACLHPLCCSASSFSQNCGEPGPRNVFTLRLKAPSFGLPATHVSSRVGGAAVIWWSKGPNWEWNEACRKRKCQREMLIPALERKRILSNQYLIHKV